jgi:macrolide transport system ATP-binding/permease protein
VRVVVTRAVGPRILVNNLPFTIAGVAAPAFFGINPAARTDIFLPMHTSRLLNTMYPGDPNARYADRNRYWIGMMGRLRPGVTMAQAQAALERNGTPTLWKSC